MQLQVSYHSLIVQLHLLDNTYSYHLVYMPTNQYYQSNGPYSVSRAQKRVVMPLLLSNERDRPMGQIEHDRL
jgi:hypothetical protein